MPSEMTRQPWEQAVRSAEAALSRNESELYIGHIRDAISLGWKPSSHHLSHRERDILSSEGLLDSENEAYSSQSDLALNGRGSRRISLEDEEFAISLSAERESRDRSCIVWRQDQSPEYPVIVYNAFSNFEGDYYASHFPAYILKRRLKRMKETGCSIEGYSKLDNFEIRRAFPRWQELIHLEVLQFCQNGTCDSALLKHPEWIEWRRRVKGEKPTF